MTITTLSAARSSIRTSSKVNGKKQGKKAPIGKIVTPEVQGVEALKAEVVKVAKELTFLPAEGVAIPHWAARNTLLNFIKTPWAGAVVRDLCAVKLITSWNDVIDEFNGMTDVRVTTWVKEKIAKAMAKAVEDGLTPAQIAKKQIALDKSALALATWMKNYGYKQAAKAIAEFITHYNPNNEPGMVNVPWRLTERFVVEGKDPVVHEFNMRVDIQNCIGVKLSPVFRAKNGTLINA